MTQVDMTRGADHDDGARRVIRIRGELMRPASLVLESVIDLALGFEVMFARGAGRPRDYMIQIAFGGRAGTVRRPAGDVAGTNVIGESGGRSIGLASIIEEISRHRIGDQPAPRAAQAKGEVSGSISGDRPMAGELGGVIVQPEKRFQPDGDQDMCAQTRAAVEVSSRG